MKKDRMLLIGVKETFIVRVLMKNIRDAGIDCEFVPCAVDAVNSAIADVSLVVLYMEDGALPSEDVIHFLSDKMVEKSIHMIPVGQKQDVDEVCRRIPEGLIYKSYSRPVDNAAFEKDIADYYERKGKEEFKKSILIVDDDTHYLTMVREWLKDKYKVSMANSGLQAIKWLGKNRVDLILLDYEMPVTSGPQVLEMLRSDDETKDIPVMFLTGKSDKKSVMAVVELKPEGYFLKSIQKDELLEKLEEYFILHK